MTPGLKPFTVLYMFSLSNFTLHPSLYLCTIFVSSPVKRIGIPWDGMVWDGMEWDRRNGMGWMGWDGMGWNEIKWNGMRWNGME